MKHGWHDFSAKIFLSYTLRVLIWQPLWRSRTSFIEKKKVQWFRISKDSNLLMMDSQFFANILLRQHQHNSFVKRFHELWNFWAPIRKQFNKRGVVSIYNLVAQVCLRLAVRHCFFFTWSQLRKEVSVWQRSYHSPTNENLPWEKPWGLFYYHFIQIHTLFFYPPVCRSPVYSFSVGLYCPKLWAVLRIYSATIHS